MKDLRETEEDSIAVLGRAMQAAQSELGEGVAFIMLATPFGEESTLRYGSNMDRETAICVLKEWLIKCGAEEDWMKHL